ncbi:MAG TPA: hypothetical protein VMU30_07430 [Bacteroidota bacterium]|nr:hypothetical protein [Bacteroidota bacterium]
MLRFLAILISWYCVGGIICFFDKTLTIQGKNVGYFEDITFWVLGLVQLVLVYSISNILKKFETVMSQLPTLLTNDISENTKAEFEMFLHEELEKIRNYVAIKTPTSRRHYWICVAGWSILVYIFQIHIPIFFPQEKVAWTISPTLYPRGYIFGLLWAIFVYVVVASNTFWYGYSTTFKIFSFIRSFAKHNRLLIVPIAPDGKGGLEYLGSLSFAFTIASSSGMLIVVSWILLYGLTPALLVSFCLYTIGLAIAFFLPLLSIHFAMKTAKKNELHRLSTIFRNSYSELHNSNVSTNLLLSTNEPTMTHRIGFLADIDQLYHGAEKMPVWPFNIETIIKFFTLIVIPILIAFGQIATQNKLSAWLQGLF